MAFIKKVRYKDKVYEYQVESTRVKGRGPRQKYLGKSGDSKVVRDYRENFGWVGPILAEEIRKAELRWPQEWIRAAMREAVLNNKLSFAYVVSICNRYERDGFSPPRREVVEGMMQGVWPEATKHNWKVRSGQALAEIQPSAEAVHPWGKAIEPQAASKGDVISTRWTNVPRYHSPFVICGFHIYEHPNGSPPYLGHDILKGLLLGLVGRNVVHHFCGFVDIRHELKDNVYSLLQEIKIENCPFTQETELEIKRKSKHRNIVWVNPTLVADIRYSEFTKNDKLTMPSFERLRADLKAEDLRGELPRLRVAWGVG